jgi:hypothetical protein
VIVIATVIAVSGVVAALDEIAIAVSSVLAVLVVLVALDEIVIVIVIGTLYVYSADDVPFASSSYLARD